MKKRKKSGHIARTRGEQIGYAIIMLVLGLFAFSTIYPVWHVVMSSISDSKLSMSGGFFFWPRGFSLKSYKMVFQTSQIWIAYRNSILVTFVGTIMSVGLSAITAYPLSRKDMPGRAAFTFIVFFTMLFTPFYGSQKSFMALIRSRYKYIKINFLHDFINISICDYFIYISYSFYHIFTIFC